MPPANSLFGESQACPMGYAKQKHGCTTCLRKFFRLSNRLLLASLPFSCVVCSLSVSVSTQVHTYTHSHTDIHVHRCAHTHRHALTHMQTNTHRDKHTCILTHSHRDTLTHNAYIMCEVYTCFRMSKSQVQQLFIFLFTRGYKPEFQMLLTLKYNDIVT